jgi:hypothetical protein
MVVFLDDLRREPRKTYEQVLAFLGVPSDGRTEFPILHAAKRQRWPWLAELLRRRPPWVESTIRALRAAGLGRVYRRLSAAPRHGPLVAFTCAV